MSFVDDHYNRFAGDEPLQNEPFERIEECGFLVGAVHSGVANAISQVAMMVQNDTRIVISNRGRVTANALAGMARAVARPEAAARVPLIGVIHVGGIDALTAVGTMAMMQRKAAPT